MFCDLWKVNAVKKFHFFFLPNTFSICQILCRHGNRQLVCPGCLFILHFGISCGCSLMVLCLIVSWRSINSIHFGYNCCQVKTVYCHHKSGQDFFQQQKDYMLLDGLGKIYFLGCEVENFFLHP